MTYFSDDEGKSAPPNNTVMVRGLAQHITRDDINNDIASLGLAPKDIRLIRKKATGTSYQRSLVLRVK